MNKRAGCSWSGGKDSCYALMHAISMGYHPHVLINMMNENGKISRSHGLPEAVLRAQAEAMQVPLIVFPSSWNDYERHFVAALTHAREVYGVDTMVFGDIDLQPHRDWEEKVCKAAAVSALLPLWQLPRKPLVMEMLDAGIETVIVSCNTVMGERFLGKQLSASVVAELEALQIDPCGENGEFHTVVVHCPLFNERVVLPAAKPVLHDGYWFLQWSTADPLAYVTAAP